MRKIKITRSLLFVSIMLFWFSQYVYVPYQTPYLFSLGAASAFIGVIIGAYGFSQMLVRIPVGIFADIYKRQKAFIIAGIICAAFASVIRAVFPIPEAFLIANLISGLASAIWISFTVFYSSLFKENELKKAMGLSMTACNGGIMLGFIIGAFINDGFGITYVFISSTIAAITALICVIFIKEEYQEKNTQRFKNFFMTFKNKRIIFYSFIAIVFEAVVASTVFSFTTSYAKKITVVEFEIGACSAVFIAASLISSFFISAVKKWKNRILLMILFGCFAVYCALLPFSGKVWHLYLLQIIAGIGNGGIMPLLLAEAITDVNKEVKCATMGYFQALYSAGTTLGPVLMGFLIKIGGYKAGYFAMALLSVICIIILFAVKTDLINNKTKGTKNY